MVEFLTPSFEANETQRPFAALGVDAHSLHHLNYLIRERLRRRYPIAVECWCRSRSRNAMPFTN
jgi:hypothetical protein